MATVKLRGFRELDKALSELPKATGKAVLTRVAKGSLAILQDTAKSRAPIESGRLRESIQIVRSKDADFAKRARESFLSFGTAKGVKRGKSTGVSFSVGPVARKSVNRRSGRATGLYAYAYYQEFGTENMSANPYMRPAWDGEKWAMLDYVKDNLATEIAKSAKRLAKRRARLG